MSVQRTGYESARPTGVCSQSGRAFEAGERYVATLVETPEDESFTRVDFSVSAWDGGARPSGRVVAVWRTVAAGRGEGGSRLLDDEELLGLFEGMEDEAGGRAGVFRYLLGLLLLRKRVLRVVDQRVGEGGRPVLQLARRGGPKDVAPEIHEVVDPGMDEDAVAAGIEELSAVMMGGEAVGHTRGGE